MAKSARFAEEKNKELDHGLLSPSDRSFISKTGRISKRIGQA
jgi:hypothetical protein